VGQAKAQAVAQRAADLDPSCRVRAIAGDIRDTMSPESLRPYRAVVGAVDNFEARLRLNQLCLIAGVDLINAAIDSRFVSVETYPYSRWDVACYECHLPESAYQRVAQRYSCGGLRKVAFREQKVATTVITASIAGAMAAAAALRLGERAKPPNAAPPQSQRVFCDTHSMASQVSGLARQDGCACCSGFATRPTIEPTDANWRALLQAMTRNELAVLTITEPIIVSCVCARCGGAVSTAVGQRARDHDDSLSCCKRCDKPSMSIEIRDRFAPDEFLALYADSTPSVAYALLDDGAQQRCLSLRRVTELQ
jgi:molybdopterin-synthase adenylyltransferase